jgi:hypothetical protein
MKEKMYSVPHKHSFVGFRQLQMSLKRSDISPEQVGSTGNASGLNSGDA